MTANSPSSTAGVLLGLLAAAVLVAAGIVGIVAVARVDPSGDGGNGLSSSFDYDIEKYMRVAPELIGFQQIAEFPLSMKDVRAVAVGPQDEVYIAGDQQLIVLSGEGKPLRQIALDGRPSCLALGHAEHAHPGRIYVGTGSEVNSFSPDGEAVAAWAVSGPKAVLTSIALAEEDVFVADAGGKVVWRYDLDGQLQGKIGRQVGDRDGPVFVIPQAHFDVAITPDQLLRVVNSGARRIDAFTFDGDPMVQWGKAGPAVDRFFGCCNPVSMCVLPDGRFVTAEKGLPRVKVYDIGGKFESVVAGPQQLLPTQAMVDETRSDHQPKWFDVAADSRGRVLVLDPHRQSVRVFEEKQQQPPGEPDNG